LSRKKKIIISVIAAVLVLATVLGVVAAVIGRQHDIKREQEEYEQAKNATNKHETTDPPENTSSEDLPPVINPDDTGDEGIKDEIILDVSDKDRNPNPEVIDATIEYGTKESEETHAE
jgi:flagellar basal body-associated protein FliL